jgi:hypothetical protein
MWQLQRAPFTICKNIMANSGSLSAPSQGKTTVPIICELNNEVLNKDLV